MNDDYKTALLILKHHFSITNSGLVGHCWSVDYWIKKYGKPFYRKDFLIDKQLVTELQFGTINEPDVVTITSPYHGN
jgi:hypothetical protein